MVDEFQSGPPSGIYRVDMGGGNNDDRYNFRVLWGVIVILAGMLTFVWQSQLDQITRLESRVSAIEGASIKDRLQRIEKKLDDYRELIDQKTRWRKR